MRGLVPHWEAVELVDGQSIHAGCASLYCGHPLEEAYDAMIRCAAGNMPKDLLPAQKDKFQEKMDWFCRILRAYDIYRLEKDDFQVIGVETSFCVTLGEVCYECGAPYEHDQKVYDPKVRCEICRSEVHWLAGRADLITKKGKSIRIMDHKTAQGASAKTLDGWKYTFQQLGYLYGVSKALDYNVTGYTINILKKLKTIGTEKAKGEPFLRQDYTANRCDIDRMIANRLTLIKDISHELKELEAGNKEFFAMSDNSCRIGPCTYAKLDWGATPWDQWQEPNAMLVNEFKVRETDYVDDMINEEVV